MTLDHFERKSFCLRHEGTALVRAAFSFPVFSGEPQGAPEKRRRKAPPKPPALYPALASRAETFVRRDLWALALRDFDADPSPDKRFFFAAFDYAFEVIEVAPDSFALSVTLSRRGETLSRFSRTQTFDGPFLAPNKKGR